MNGPNKQDRRTPFSYLSDDSLFSFSPFPFPQMAATAEPAPISPKDQKAKAQAEKMAKMPRLKRGSPPIRPMDAGVAASPAAVSLSSPVLRRTRVRFQEPVRSLVSPHHQKRFAERYLALLSEYTTTNKERMSALSIIRLVHHLHENMKQ